MRPGDMRPGDMLRPGERAYRSRRGDLMGTATQPSDDGRPEVNERPREDAGRDTRTDDLGVDRRSDDAGGGGTDTDRGGGGNEPL